MVWDSGVVVLTGNFQLIALNSFSDSHPTQIHVPLTEMPHCWTIVPPERSLSKHVEVLLAVEKTIYIADSSQCQDQNIENGPFQRVAVSPNSSFLALFTSDGRLWVVSIDFQKTFADFQTNSTEPPLQMAWCGNDSVLLHWEDTMFF